MRYPVLFAALSASLSLAAERPGATLWSELKAKREQLPGAHQEFEVSRTLKTANSNQSSKRQVVLDMAQGRWREKSISGSGEYTRIFDGKDLLAMEDGGNEFVRTKRRPKDEDPAPSPYNGGDQEWPKAMELERRPCGLTGVDHLCVVLDVPLKRWVRTNSRMVQGTARLILDTETGLLIALRTVEMIENQRGPYQSDVTYALKRIDHLLRRSGRERLPVAFIRYDRGERPLEVECGKNQKGTGWQAGIGTGGNRYPRQIG